MDAKIAHIGVTQQRAHRVGHAADADLQAGAIFDLGRYQPGHLLLDRAAVARRDLGQRRVAVIDDEIDFAGVDGIIRAGHTRHGRGGLDDDHARA